MRTLSIPALFCALALATVHAQSPYQSSSDFAKYAMKLRENALLRIEPQVMIPTTGRSLISGRYPWKTNIVTTVFWVGEQPAMNNPVSNKSSSWDRQWQTTFGGFDNPDPAMRRNFIPIGFIPQQNPFYCALPYNDVSCGATKPEARSVIPWFRESFVKDGQSVCKDRWVAIRNPANSRIAYAQWSDCGPFCTDNWEYVFRNDRPRPNLNRGAGLDVSPAVRDYLGLAAKLDVTDWKFVEFREVPSGPWSRFGENNDFVQMSRRGIGRVASKTPVTVPQVITK